jgi:hypothetical protein
MALLKMALLLADGGFVEEAMPVLSECLTLAGNAQAVLNGEVSRDATTSDAKTFPHVVRDAAAPQGSSALADAAHSASSMLTALRRDLTTPQAAE